MRTLEAQSCNNPLQRARTIQVRAIQAELQLLQTCKRAPLLNKPYPFQGPLWGKIDAPTRRACHKVSTGVRILAASECETGNDGPRYTRSYNDSSPTECGPRCGPCSSHLYSPRWPFDGPEHACQTCEFGDRRFNCCMGEIEFEFRVCPQGAAEYNPHFRIRQTIPHCHAERQTQPR